MKYISCPDLEKKLKENNGIQLIDVRESYEYEEQNIGGINVPLAELIEKKDLISKNKDVVICCKTGKRSAAMSFALERKFGLKNLYTLQGGLENYFNTIK